MQSKAELTKKDIVVTKPAHILTQQFLWLLRIYFNPPMMHTTKLFFASNFVVSIVVQMGVLEFAQRCNDWKTYSGSSTQTNLPVPYICGC